MHDLTAAAQWMLKFAFIALQVSFLSTAMHVVHPINGSSFYSSDLLLSVDFFPGVEPSTTTPLWVQLFELSDSHAQRNEADTEIKPSDSTISHAYQSATNHNAVLTHFGNVCVNEAGQHLLVHAFDLPAGAYRLDLRLASLGHEIVSQQTHQTIYFTLLDFYDEAEVVSIENSKSLGSADSAEATSTAFRSDCSEPLVVDAFPFFNELDLLEARLHELNDVVDVFLLVESKVTHSGIPKELHWRDGGALEQRFERFLPKVHAVALDNLDSHLSSNQSNHINNHFNISSHEPDIGRVSDAAAAAMLDREVNQRDAIVQALQTIPPAFFDRLRNGTRRRHPKLLPHDLVLVSDVDEIPRRGAIDALKQRWPRCFRDLAKNRIVAPVRFIMDWYLYSFDFIAPRPWGITSREGAYAVPFHMLLPSNSGGLSNDAFGFDTKESMRTGTPSQWRRALRSREAAALSFGKNSNGADTVMALGLWSSMGGAGWHLSSFGGVAAVRSKLKAYIGAASFDNALYADDARLERLLRNGMAFYELASHAPLESLPGSSAHRGHEGTSPDDVFRAGAGAGGFAKRARLENRSSGFIRTPRNDSTFIASLPLFVQHLEHTGRVERSSTFGSMVVTAESDGAAPVDSAREMFMLNQDLRHARAAATDASAYNLDPVAQPLYHDEYRQDFAVDCSLEGEPAAAASAFCALHDWPALSCEVVLEQAMEGCQLILAAASTGTNRHLFRTTFGLDVLRRFLVQADGFKEPCIVEVGPWDDVRSLAIAEGSSLGMDAATVDRLALWIEGQLNDDDNFQFFRRRHLARMATDHLEVS